MVERKIGRKRGAILTDAGEYKLRSARVTAEQTKNFGQRYTKEQLSEMSGLSYKTIAKIFGAGFATTEEKFPVDKQTLDICFATFDLTLERQDYIYPDEIDPLEFDPAAPVVNRVILSQSSNFSTVIDCGEAPDIATFYGRERELERLKVWTNEDRCRTIAILGMGGIGKTALASKLVCQIRPHFEAIVWRSLGNAPPLATLLPKLIEIFSARQEIVPPTLEISAQISYLLNYFRKRRCLLILDNTETILDSAESGYAELLRRIGESQHQSCLLLTSREKPQEIISLAGEKLPVRTIELSGLTAQESTKLFDDKGLSTSQVGRDRLVANYSGNPLALNIVSTSIFDLFAGDIDRFLETDAIVFGGIEQLLDTQFAKLSETERAVMYWLAIDREWVSLSDLHADIVPALSTSRVLESLELLSRKSLIERNQGKFTQQAVVMEYITDRFIDRVSIDLTDWKVDNSQPPSLPLWLSHTLLKAQSPAYIQVIQSRFILAPIANRLISQFGHKLALTQHLKSILASLQIHDRDASHYGGGNLINLFQHLQIDLTGFDFSKLPIWQADLQGASLRDVNFSGADFAKTLFTRTFSWVSSLAFSPDSQLLATSDHRGDIYLWRVSDKYLQTKLIGHTNWIWEMAFSPDGQTLASTCQDGTIHLWDVKTGALIRVLQAVDRERDGVLCSCLAFHPAGKILATGHYKGDLRLWDVTTGQSVNTVAAHVREIVSVKFSPDGRSLATGGEDDTVKIWEIADGGISLHQALPNDRQRIWSIRFSPDGKLLAIGNNDGTIQIWDRSTWQVLGLLPVYHNWLFAMSFSPDSQALAVGALDHTVKIWDVRPHTLASSQPEAIATLHGHQSLAAALEFSADGKFLATSGRDRSIRLWHTGNWQELYCWQGYHNWIQAVIFTAEGDRVITGAQEGIVQIWDVRTGESCLNLTQQHCELFSIDYHPDPVTPTIASASRDDSIKIWDANAGELVRTMAFNRGTVQKIKFSPDRRLLAISCTNWQIYLQSTTTGELISTLNGHRGLVTALAFSPNSQLLLATGCLDNCWRLWDVNTSQMLGCYAGHAHWIWDVAFSPTGTLLATASADTTAKLWNVTTGELVRTFAGHTDEVMAIAFSPHDRQLATGSIDRAIKIWDIDTGELLQTLTGHGERVLSLSYSPDGKVLASGSADETIKFWDLQTGTCTRTCKPPPPYQGMNITDATGLTPATIATLKTLGAIETT